MSKVSQDALVVAPPKRETNHSPTPIIAVGVTILVVFFGAIALWGYLAPLHAAVHAQGEVIFQNKRQSVQHQEGGVIKKILVKDGETVKAGQPLIVLEDDQVKPVVDMYEGQAMAERATVCRLEAEKNDLPAVVFPRGIPAAAMETETRLFKAKREAYLKQVDMVRSQIRQSKEIINGAQEQLAAKKKEIASLKEQLEANVNLRKEGYVTKTTVLDLERGLAEKSGEREQLMASVASNQQKVVELEQRILSLKAERIASAAAEIKQSGLKRIELEERVRPSRAVLTRGVIRAPVSGKVVGLNVATVGGVVAPRESLMEIAPLADNLIVQGKIGVNDVSDVKIGQEAEVTLTAFKSTKIPPVKATVTYVSDDRLTSRTAQGDTPYFSAYLELDRESVRKLGGLQLMPGMQAQVAITTKPRTAFDYFLAPLRDRMSKVNHAR